MTPHQKALRARTIIPDSLYVDRDADRQLNDVIDEMGRPGYILVARQMGKTNLLLRMKRRREQLHEIAVYVDLSIGFSEARGLFRHLIDSLLEVLPMDDVRAAIERERIDTDLDASVEYDRHLRRILTAAKMDRVIIILDEIDALVGQTYSDRVLSQVRSMYFARANFPIYEHLTYVLSGVAEPTDLIKDKNISPFNIGEKIYLNDFSKSEAFTLLQNAGITFDDDVKEAVYAWTSGNPRMTWDVYSALEDELAASNTVNVETVNTVVQKLYLTRYDRAPLDHIRALAENDPEVRAALIALLYGKGDTLDDRSRSKLYLAGITTASANEAPRIKNRVIEFALSETWLAQVEAGRSGLLAAAGQRYTNGTYSESVELFRHFLNSEGSIETFSDLDVLQFGMALYHLGEYAEAVSMLERAAKMSRSSEVRSMVNYHIGLSTMLLGQINNAIQIFETLSKTPGLYKLRAQHALGTAYLKESAAENSEKIIAINEQVLAAAPDDPDLTESDKAELTYAAHYNLGQVHMTKGRKHEAKAAFELANSSAGPKMKPAFASVRLDTADDADERRAILREVTDVLVRDNVPYSKSRGTLVFTEDNMAQLLAVAIELKERECLDQLLAEAKRRSETNAFETLVSLATETDWKSDSTHPQSLLHFALSEPEIASESLLEQKMRASAILMAFAHKDDLHEAFELYWSIASQPAATEFLSANDVIILANQVGFDLDEGKFSRAKEIVKFVRSNEKAFTSANSTLFAFFVYHEMVVYRMEANYERVLRSARQVLDLTSAESMLNDGNSARHSILVDQLRDAAQREIEMRVPPKQKFGRNEFLDVIDVNTGVRQRVKYKKIANRLARGEVQLVSE